MWFQKACDKMKRTINLLIVFILLGSLLPFAYAEDPEAPTNDDPLEETNQQVEIMKYGIGSDIRLLQLEKSIITNIEKAQEIILSLKGSNMNTTILEVILLELEFLKEEVQLANPNASDAVTIFVDLKHDAINLTKEFKDTVHGLINETTMDQLRDRIHNMSCNQTQNISGSIRQKIREYNANQFRYFYQLFNEQGSKYINEYQNGSLTQYQLKENITKRIHQKGEATQFDIIISLKQGKIQNKLQAQSRIQNATKGSQQRLEKRLENRLMRSENLSNSLLQQEIMKKIQNKLNQFGNTDNTGNQNGNQQGQQDTGHDGDETGNDSGEGGPGVGGQNGNNGPNNSGGGGGNI